MNPNEQNPLLMEELPQTLEQLLERIGKLFHCMTGPKMAYFEIPLADRVAYGDPPMEPSFERLVYVTLGWRTPSSRTPSVEARLVMAILEPFLEARRQLLERKACALLFWCRPLSIEEYEDTDHAGNPLGRKSTRITCRVVIPGANLSHYAHAEGDLLKSV